jgi:hypothetical protein
MFCTTRLAAKTFWRRLAFNWQSARWGIARHPGAAWPPLHDNGHALAFLVGGGRSATRPFMRAGEVLGWTIDSMEVVTREGFICLLSPGNPTRRRRRRQRCVSAYVELVPEIAADGRPFMWASRARTILRMSARQASMVANLMTVVDGARRSLLFVPPIGDSREENGTEHHVSERLCNIGQKPRPALALSERDRCKRCSDSGGGNPHGP